MIIPFLIIVIILLSFLVYFFYQKNQVSSNIIKTLELETNQLSLKYKPIIDVDKSVNEQKLRVIEIQNEVDNLKLEYSQKRQIFESLLKEISIIEDDLENISYGLYKPTYNYDTSERFKIELEKVYEKQKEYIKNDKAVKCLVEWNVGGSRREGEKMTKQYAKLMLRAFNGECDAAISKVKWNNIVNMEARIYKAFESINKLGSTHQIFITDSYKNLMLDELRLEYELQEKLHQEKEEQRAIREQMKEEERAIKEYERALKEAEEEEKRYSKALEKARHDILTAQGKELDSLQNKIGELEKRLSDAQALKERAISMAQMTKCGYVYIISNIGAFGEDVFKIGMTRRLEPMDRIRELGDASVPFLFDTHALIYSENAPELENKLHKKFDSKKLNLINNRREFFKVPIDEIEKTIKELGLEMELNPIAEAREFRESISIRDAQNNILSDKIIEEKLDIFPVSL